MLLICSCQQDSTHSNKEEIYNSQEKILDQGEHDMKNITFIVNDKKFNIELEDNATAKAFVETLPTTLSMSDLNHNEKYCYLSEDLPTHEQNIENIQTGDVMLFGNNCLVIFYESFPTSYKYTRIGKITAVSNLKEILGNGRVEISFEITE